MKNFRILCIFLVIFCHRLSAHELAEETSEESQKLNSTTKLLNKHININGVTEKSVIPILRELLLLRGLDPVKIQDFSIAPEYKLPIWPYSIVRGTIFGSDVRISGFSKVKLAGDVQVIFEGENINLTCEFEIRRIRSFFNYKIASNLLNNKGYATATARKVHATVSLTYNMPTFTFTNGTVHSLSVGRISIDLSDLSTAQSIINTVLNTGEDGMKDTVINLATEKLNLFIGDSLTKLNKLLDSHFNKFSNTVKDIMNDNLNAYLTNNYT